VTRVIKVDKVSRRFGLSDAAIAGTLCAMPNRAVLVIDTQQGLCVGPGAAHDCSGTIARINPVTARAQAAGVPMIFIQYARVTTVLARDFTCAP